MGQTARVWIVIGRKQGSTTFVDGFGIVEAVSQKQKIRVESGEMWLEGAPFPGAGPIGTTQGHDLHRHSQFEPSQRSLEPRGMSVFGANTSTPGEGVTNHEDTGIPCGLLHSKLRPRKSGASTGEE
jgi:hypothetical protein